MKLVLDRVKEETMLMMSPLELPEFDVSLLPEAKQLEGSDLKRRPLIVVQHECLGHVSAPAGCALLAGMLEQFVSLETLPAAVILQGVGVRLTDPANPARDALARFISLQVPVLVCEQSAKTLGAECQMAGCRLASQREIAQHLISNPAIVWL